MPWLRKWIFYIKTNSIDMDGVDIDTVNTKTIENGDILFCAK